MDKKYSMVLFCAVLALGFSACKKNEARITVKEPDPVIGATPGSSLNYDFTLGVNLNEQADAADMNDLADTKTKWVRSFIDFIPVYKAQSAATDPKIAAFIALKSKGYHTVLNLKFDFRLQGGFPALNSSDWNGYISYISTVLDRVMPYTDVLIVGNEPFIEANQSDWNEPLNTFYKAASARVYDYFKTNNIDKPIFLGAFDNMYLSGRTGNAGINSLLNFAKSTIYLKGVDVHIHHTTNTEMLNSLKYVGERIRDDQKMMITEFSLVKYYESYATTDIDAAFIAAANASTSDRIYPPPAGVTKNYQYIDYALKNPRPAAEWYAFWQYSPYLQGAKDYICTSYENLKNNGKVFAGFYALRQSYPFNTDFTETTDPWVMNGLFMNRTVEQVDGRNQKGYSFLDQFQKAVQGQNPCQ